LFQQAGVTWRSTFTTRALRVKRRHASWWRKHSRKSGGGSGY